MADLFYQGEDISLVVDLFEDEHTEERVNLSEVDVDVLLYTSKKEKIWHASTKNGADLKIVSILGGRSLSLIVPAKTSLQLSPGVLTVEMKVTNRVNSSVKIAVSSAIRIEPSIIGSIP